MPVRLERMVRLPQQRSCQLLAFHHQRRLAIFPACIAYW